MLRCQRLSREVKDLSTLGSTHAKWYTKHKQTKHKTAYEGSVTFGKYCFKANGYVDYWAEITLNLFFSCVCPYPPHLAQGVSPATKPILNRVGRSSYSVRPPRKKSQSLAGFYPATFGTGETATDRTPTRSPRSRSTIRFLPDKLTN